MSHTQTPSVFAEERVILISLVILLGVAGYFALLVEASAVTHGVVLLNPADFLQYLEGALDRLLFFDA